MKKPVLFSLLTLMFLISFISCKKESFTSSPDALLTLTADTIKFDTVFTNTGNITRQFKIVNENDRKLLLSEVSLSGGTASPFKLNINGVSSSYLTNIELGAKDSMYVFVTAYVNAGSANLPFIITDSVLVEYNGNKRYVQLEAYGQNANFISNRTISTNTTWPADKPYVILGSLRVAVGASLTLQAGCRIYVHGNAPILIDGSLKANGTVTSPVIFTGDRLDDPYKNFPASWPGLYFRDSSINNQLSFTSILNAYDALAAFSPALNGQPKLVLKQCRVDNAYNTGIFSSNSSIVADNCLITNSGFNVYLQYGGTYNFTHCTIAGYSNNYVIHRKPAVTISDFTQVNGNTLYAALSAIFRNSIIWAEDGNLQTELQVTKQGPGPFSVLVDHCIYRSATNPANTTLTQSLQNQDPSFDSIDVSHRYFDFHITKNPLAPGINKGINSGLLIDLDNNNRNVGLPDLGCYEKQ